MERSELAAWLRLSLTEGVGTGTARRLLAAFGLPTQIFQQPAEALQQIVSPAQASALASEAPELAASVEITQEWLDGAPGTRHVLTLADATYPPALLQT